MNQPRRRLVRAAAESESCAHSAAEPTYTHTRQGSVPVLPPPQYFLTFVEALRMARSSSADGSPGIETTLGAGAGGGGGGGGGGGWGLVGGGRRGRWSVERRYELLQCGYVTRLQSTLDRRHRHVELQSTSGELRGTRLERYVDRGEGRGPQRTGNGRRQPRQWVVLLRVLI